MDMEAPLQLTAAFHSPAIAADTLTPARLASAGLVQDVHAGLSSNPHILLVAASSLASTARLAVELHRSGARVSLITPAGHPARVLKFFKERTTHSVLRPWKLLEKCLHRWKPDAVLACDERTVRDLHELHARTTDRSIQSFVEQSLGPSSGFATVRSRDRLLSLARALGLRVPESTPVPDEVTLDAWLRQQPAPFVMKADGSWAGFGVRIISDKRVAHQAWQEMRQPTAFYMAARSLLLDHDAFGLRSWMQGEHPVLSVQSYVDGWPANIGVACWRGEILATNCAEAVATLSATGPSTVARIIQNNEMVHAATAIVRVLGLSGLIGFDFMVEAATGHAHLIEMNPRVTPICTIPLGAGHDLPEAFTARLAGRMPQDRPPRTDSEIIAYFPDTWRQDASNRLLQTAFHDVPWDEPDLVRRLMQPDAIDRNFILRHVRLLRRQALPRQGNTH